MVQQIGAQAVSADVTNFGAKFNNGQVDIIGAPAAVFKPLELHKAWNEGAIKLSDFTGHIYIIIRPDKFLQVMDKNHGNGLKAKLPRAFGILVKMKAEIPSKILDAVFAADQPAIKDDGKHELISPTAVFTISE